MRGTIRKRFGSTVALVSLVGSLGVCLGIDTEGSTDPFVSGNVIR